MPDNDSQIEFRRDDADERVVVVARVSKDEKQRIENQLSYDDHLQDWLEDTIDRKLTADDRDLTNRQMG